MRFTKLRNVCFLISSACLAIFPLHAQRTYKQHGPIRIVVPANAPVISRFMGLGIEFDPYQYPPSPARWKTIEKRVAWVHPGFLRVMSGPKDYCEGFNTAGKPIYVWQHPNAATERRLHRLLAVLDFAQAHHISVYLGEWSPSRSLGPQNPGNPRWANMIATFVDYLIRVRHYTVIRHYIFMNEPNGQWMWAHKKPDFNEWAKGIRNLRRDLNARGLESVAITGPDNSGDPAWFARSVKQLHREFGAWEMHIYATDQQIFGDKLEKTLRHASQVIDRDDPEGVVKERFIAESGIVTGKIQALDQQPRVRTFGYGVEMADYVAQVARAGWMGADAWDLDDAMHGDGHGKLKIWGFWNSSPSSPMTIRPWFYTWALMSRLFPEGAQILDVHSDPTPPRFRVVADRWGSVVGLQSTVMLVNDGGLPRTVRLSFSAAAHRSLYIYRYFRHKQKVNAQGMPLPAATLPASRGKSQLTLKMPSHGVVFVTTAKL